MSNLFFMPAAVAMVKSPSVPEPQRIRNVSIAILALLIFITPAVALVSIIPKPNQMTVNEAALPFVISSSTRIMAGAGDTAAIGVANMLRAMLLTQIPSLAAVSEYSGQDPAAGTILLTRSGADTSLGEEGYIFTANKDAAVIRAVNRKGLFWGVQTLRQLLPYQIESTALESGITWSIPEITITDKPLYAYRGLMIDLSRTFFPKKYLLHYIDLMALYKNSKFHLHLTDDQGWRVESLVYPQLHQKGAFWTSGANPTFGDGYLSQQDVRDIVRYAADRNIEIIPEIELPAHSRGMMHAMPELACNQPRNSDEFNIWPFLQNAVTSFEPICPDNRFGILDTIVNEFAALFPSRYLHLGNDEVQVFGAWNSSAEVQTLKSREGLSNNTQVQAYFSKRMETILKNHGKTMMTWNEARTHSISLPGSLSRLQLDSNSVSMHWTGSGAGMFENTYILASAPDLYYDITAAGSLSPYTFDPEAKVASLTGQPITQRQREHLWGLQGQMWTHIERTEASVESKVFPTHIATSEIAWTAKAGQNYTDFVLRLDAQTPRLDLISSIYYNEPDSAIAYWTFNELSGTTARDSVGGHDGTLTGGAARAAGYSGNGLELNAANEKMTIGGAPIAFSGGWSIAFWVKIGNHNTWSLFMQNNDSAELRLDQWNGTNKVGFTQRGVADYSFNYSLPLNTWVYLTVVRQGTGTKLYVNGILTGTVNAVINPPMSCIGGLEAIDGVVDEVRLYKGSLTASRVLTLYKSYVPSGLRFSSPGKGAGFSAQIAGASGTVSIYSISGKKLFEYAIKPGHPDPLGCWQYGTGRMSSLLSGIYIVRLKSSTGEESRKYRLVQ